MARATVFLFLLLAPAAIRAGEPAGMLQGAVKLLMNGEPVHNASVLLVQLGRTVNTDFAGRYEFRDLPPGRYTVIAHMYPLADQRQTAVITPGETLEIDFHLNLSPVREEITVTASGRGEAANDSFKSVSATAGLELASVSSASLGEALQNESGVAKRSSGPGASRPVIRGFDGDRVLILQDGMPTGTLSSQSGDHGEPFDVSNLDQVEVVRGPATLLYGANAIGGVVNAITEHHKTHEHAHPGARGFLNSSGGSANALGGGNGGFDVGFGKWVLSGSGGGLRTGDFNTPLGFVENSHTKIAHSSAGVARYGDNGFADIGYGVFDGRYGVPLIPELGDGAHVADSPTDAEHQHEVPVDLKWRRHNIRFSGALKNLSSAFESLNVQLNYSDWKHREMVEEEAHTRFSNRQLSYRAVLEQRRSGVYSGSFGMSGIARRYEVRGGEALTPPVAQESIGMFALEELEFERVRFQFGARAEMNGYRPEGLRHRSFAGLSASLGTNVRLWNGGAAVASYSNSYRAPALEELYNTGPHPGNLAYEVGDPGLKRERSHGVDLSLRHSESRLRAELNYFYYRIFDYVFMDRTGEVRDGFLLAEYRQANAKYRGGEVRLDLAAHPNFWINASVDAVQAGLTKINMPLPRIPPVRGTLGFDARYKDLSVRPEWLLSGAQTELSPGETRTAGYGLVNVLASYTIIKAHGLHSLSLNVFNVGNVLYRNHLSFLKDFVPEIGRGVRVAYSVRFF